MGSAAMPLKIATLMLVFLLVYAVVLVVALYLRWRQ